MAAATGSGIQNAGRAKTSRRRGRALLPNVTIWAIFCGIVVIVVHAATAQATRHWSEYWTGLATLILFLAVGYYSVRKRNQWISLRMLRATSHLPRPLQRRFIVLDRLETWRAAHITVGVLALLPLWWHMRAGVMSGLELALAVAVALLMVSGFIGVVIQDYLPHAVGSRAEHEVRLRDVAGRVNEAAHEAGEKILGHSEALIQAYLKHIKPVMDGESSRWLLLRSTILGVDAGETARPSLLTHERELGNDGAVWRELVELAAHKVNLDQNGFNLVFSNEWLPFHVALAIVTFVLIAFHVASVIYFNGI